MPRLKKNIKLETKNNLTIYQVDDQIEDIQEKIKKYMVLHLSIEDLKDLVNT